MDHHVPRPLPDPSQFPYGLVRLIVWKPQLDQNASWSGQEYINKGDVWRSLRGYPWELEVGEEVDWSFDGYRFDYYNRGALIQPESKTPALVKLALWALDRWAVDVGLKEKMDKPRTSVFFEKIEAGESVQLNIDN